MSFFKSIKQAFGFGETEYDDDELEGIDARVTPLRDRKDTQAPTADSNEANTHISDSNNDMATDTTDSTTDGSETSAPGDTLPLEIFDAVIKVFNEALPEFLQKSVDAETQKKYLYEHLEASTREYLEKAGSNAQQRCNNRWAQERQQLLAEIESLKQLASKEEEGVSEAKKQQLSAERQKRALSERVHELEKQVASIEAENEQYVLENKSLINKLRLTQVVGADGQSAEATEKLVELTGEIESLQKQLTDSSLAASQLQSALEKKEEEMREMQKAAESHEEEYSVAIAVNNELTAEAKAQKQEIENLRKALDQSKAKDDLGDAMLTDLNRKTAEAVKSAQEAAKKVETLEAENATLRQQVAELEHSNNETTGELTASKGAFDTMKANLASLTAEHAALQVEYQSTVAKLQESMESLEVVEEMSQQLDVLEKARKNNEAYLHKLKDEIAAKNQQIHQLETERDESADIIKAKEEAIRHLEDMTDSLRKTIENNLYEHAQSESALHSEIDRLKHGQKKIEEISEPIGYSLFSDDDAIASGSAFETLPAEGSYGDTSEPTGKKKRHKKAKVTISAIDDTLEDTDWLIATPPTGKNGTKDSSDENDFGYKEPARKNAPENPAQMSLW